jgi:protein TonB
MGSPALIEQLDVAIDALMAKPERALPRVDAAVMPLLMVAAELRSLPRPSFKTQLKADLMQKAGVPVAQVIPMQAPVSRMATQTQVLPTLFGAGYGAYAAQSRNFVASFVAHVAMIALLAMSGTLFLTEHARVQEHVTALVTPDLTDFVPLSAKPTVAPHGGGGGGDRDKMQAPEGRLPKFAMEQFTPPAMVIRNDHAKLTMEPTVVAPPQIQIANSALPNFGDPHSTIVGPPSNGTGSSGGIGSGDGGGIGSGIGPGVGAGRGGGIGGGVFKVGGGVSAPRAIFAPDPQYSDEARKAKYQGTVILWVIVGADGRPRDVKVARTLGMGLDEKAIEAVRMWKFAPAMKGETPVAVQINVEVNFRLY